MGQDFNTILLAVAGHVTDELETLPYITEEISNLTVVAGREAILSCHVSHLGSYKVGRPYSRVMSVIWDLTRY